MSTLTAPTSRYAMSPHGPAKYQDSTLVFANVDGKMRSALVMYSYSSEGNEEMTYRVQIDGCHYTMNESELSSPNPITNAGCEWTFMNFYCGPVIGEMLDDMGSRYNVCADHYEQEHSHSGRDLI